MLGQNFLLDSAALEKIIEAAEINPRDEILEIGAGIGNLTKLLAQKAKFVLAVEKDKRYFPILKNALRGSLQKFSPARGGILQAQKSGANVRLEFADIMKFDYQKILNPGYKVVANIPYYITGKIIGMLFAAKRRPSKIILLVQKEVARRLAAEAGEMSVLAISVRLHSFRPEIISVVPKESFYPEPKVDSAIVRMNLRAEPAVDVDENKFFRLVKAAFAGKRKQLRNTLKNYFKLSAEETDKILKAANVNPTARPQELDLEDWKRVMIGFDPDQLVAENF